VPAAPLSLSPTSSMPSATTPPPHRDANAAVAWTAPPPPRFLDVDDSKPQQSAAPSALSTTSAQSNATEPPPCSLSSS
jgi:hypothetical protein